MTNLFNPKNPVIQLCMKGMQEEDKDNLEQARWFFDEAWENATNDFEKFIAAYHAARLQKSNEEKMKWFQQSLHNAQKVDGQNIESAYSTIYLNLAKVYQAIGDMKKRDESQKLADTYFNIITDEGPFYHGTKARLKIDDKLTAGNHSNYESHLVMNHIYFTGNLENAALAAAMAKGDGPDRIYAVEPLGEFEEVEDWANLSPTERAEWTNKVNKLNGKLIN